MNTARLPLFVRRPELHPARALLSPTWLVALVVLALNDHILKGAGVLPGWFTGKLSDFAGMIVAPVLLAALLRVRSRRGLLACHVAVGAVFAGINLSTGLADAWSWLMGFVMPWQITVDPTDLIALPTLALGWRALMPAMTRPLPAVAPVVPRLAEASAIAVGGFFCVATSEPHDDDGGDDGWSDTGDTGETDTTDVDYADIEADVYLHNGTGREVRVRTRPLRADIELDCFEVQGNPGLMLSEVLFGEGVTTTLPPSTNVAVRDLGLGRACYAVRVEGDDLRAPFVLFWNDGDVPQRWIDGDIDDPAQHTSGAVLLGEDADLRVVVQEARSQVVFAVEDVAPADAALPGPDAARLDWSDPPFGEHRLAGVEVGPDGCVAVETAVGAARWYLCVPEGAFPFVAEQWVRIADDAGAVEITSIPDPQDPMAAVPLMQLTVARGWKLPDVGEDVVLASQADFEPTLAPDPVCGTVARPSELSVRFADSDVVRLRAGESTTLTGEGREVTLWLAHAEDRVVLDPACAEGPDDLGADVEVAVLIVASEP